MHRPMVHVRGFCTPSHYKSGRFYQAVAKGLPSKYIRSEQTEWNETKHSPFVQEAKNTSIIQ